MQNTPLQKLFGHKPLVSEPHPRWPDLFGIELELEGINMDTIPTMTYWGVHRDDSLRNGIEFILRNPASGDVLTDALNEYFGRKFKYDANLRTSTHIHVNMTDASISTVRSMVVLMYILESPLYRVIGEGRKWSGYSMSLQDMDTTRLRGILTESSLEEWSKAAAHIRRNHERYYGLNTASLSRHGTVEFRYFPGGPTREELSSWLDFVQAVKKAAVQYSVEEIQNRIETEQDLIQFIQSILPVEWSDKLLQASAPDELITDFLTVLAMAASSSTFERKEQLVFLTPSLMKYMTKQVLPKQGGEHLKSVASQVSVMGLSDWQHILRTANQMENRDEDAQDVINEDYDDPENSSVRMDEILTVAELGRSHRTPRERVDLYPQPDPAEPRLGRLSEAPLAAVWAEVARMQTPRPPRQRVESISSRPPVGPDRGTSESMTQYINRREQELRANLRASGNTSSRSRPDGVLPDWARYQTAWSDIPPTEPDDESNTF